MRKSQMLMDERFMEALVHLHPSGALSVEACSGRIRRETSGRGSMK
jgi:hypothetical protein